MRDPGRAPAGMPGRPSDIQTDTRAGAGDRVRDGLAEESSPLADATRLSRCESARDADELLGLGLADSARQIVIDRRWRISVPEGLSASEVDTESSLSAANDSRW